MQSESQNLKAKSESSQKNLYMYYHNFVNLVLHVSTEIEQQDQHNFE